MEKLKTLLSIAGSDNMAGAGIQADLKAAAMCGVYCVTAITAVTAQNSKGVKALKAVSPRILKEQLDATLSEIIPDAVKIGIVGSPENGEIIKDFITNLSSDIPVIVDPVVKASAGGELIDTAYDSQTICLEIFRDIAKLPNLILVPNIREAQTLLDSNDTYTPEELAGRIINDLNANIVIVKGGHQDGDYITDCLAFQNDKEITLHTLSKTKIKTRNLHGTGCTFSSLFASLLIKEIHGINEEKQFQNSCVNAFFKTEDKMIKLIKDSVDFRLGKSTYGPLLPFQL